MADTLYAELCKEEILMDAWHRVRSKNARGGIDGLSPEDLEEGIDRIIRDLSRSLENGTYVPPPCSQIKVPKFNEASEWRRLSLPVVTDKIVQQAAVNLISPIFEKTFLDCSYAYRPGKGPVRAIGRIEHILKNSKPKWVVLFDIDNFFDTLDHKLLLSALGHGINDERFLSLVKRWLRAGYITPRGDYREPDEGVAQGSIISPLLSNIYLHPLDRFAVEKGIDYVRYSDNFITFHKEKERAYVCHEEMSAFLAEDRGLRLNEDPQTFRGLYAGFVFLGVFFKNQERRISTEKEKKTFRKINWITDASAGLAPETTLQRLNESIQSQKRFYAFLKPDRQFARFDEHMMDRLHGLLVAYGKQGVMGSRKEIEEFLSRLTFYSERSAPEKERLAQNLATEVMAQLKDDPDKSNNKEKEKEKGAGSGSARPSSSKNRYLRMVAGEAEVVVGKPGVFIGKNSRRLILREARKNIHEQPFSKIRQITVASSGVSLSSDLVHSCAGVKIPLVFMETRGKPYAVLHTPMHAHGDLSLLQVRVHESKRWLDIARKIMVAKAKNQMNVLKFYGRHRSRTDPEFAGRLKENLGRMEAGAEEIRQLAMDSTADVVRNRLFTAEARVSADYWDMIKRLLPPELGFGKRVKQGAQDVVNHMLNYGYGILYQRVWQALLSTGLNPNIGLVHALGGDRPGLVYDLVEEFRQSFVDRPLFSAMTKGKKYASLKLNSDSGLLDEFSLRETQRAVLNRLSMLMGFRGRKVKGEEIIVFQTRQLARHIRGESTTYRAYVGTY